MSQLSSYFSDLTTKTGQGWNRFWFTASVSPSLGILRIATGVVALVYWLSFLPGLALWFGPAGLVPMETLRALVGSETQQVYRLSWFYFSESPTVIAMIYFAGLLAILAHTVGIGGRWSTLIAWTFVLSAVHRLPMMAGLMEPVLTMSLLYLAIGPTTAFYSLDRWLKKRRGKDVPPKSSSLTTLALRLVQLHTLFFYVVMASTQLRHTTWWQGEALWTMLASSETRIADLTFLGNYPFVLNFATQGILLFEILFPILIWNRTLRPLLLMLSIVFWLIIGLATGMPLYALLMASLGFAFAAPVGEAAGSPSSDDSAEVNASDETVAASAS